MTDKSKNDVFVGNLTFNTTEDHLREKFLFVGTWLYLVVNLFLFLCIFAKDR